MKTTVPQSPRQGGGANYWACIMSHSRSEGRRITVGGDLLSSFSESRARNSVERILPLHEAIIMKVIVPVPFVQSPNHYAVEHASLTDLRNR